MNPILNDETEILVVGTYPGQISREKNQYYANPINQFWRLIGNILNINLEELDYESKIETLLQHKIGLWDTLKSCDITGSSDRNICSEQYNNFSNLVCVRKIVCNGKKAEKYLKHCNVPVNTEVVRVVSSSPARAMKFEEKVAEWEEVIR